MASVPAVAIHLGKTHSRVGVFLDGRARIIANDLGDERTPSYVAFTDAYNLVGKSAKHYAATDPKNTVFDVTKLIGRRFEDMSLQSDMKHWPFEVFQEDGKPRIRVEHKGEDKAFTPEEIAAMILANMKLVAEEYLGQTVSEAVVTVPVYFSESQRQATKDAAAIAGLDVLGVISEPMAAAIAYSFDRVHDGTWSDDRSMLVFHFGGSEFDVSVFTQTECGLTLTAKEGDSHLGGQDIDNRLADHFVEEFKLKHQKDLTTNRFSLHRLRATCEMAKRSLTFNKHANIDIDCLFEGVDFHSVITRAKFDDLNADLFNISLKLVEKVLSDANLEKADVDDVILVGGSTRILKIQELLRDFFDGKQPCKDIDPEVAVAYGAAARAAILTGVLPTDVREFRLKPWRT